MKILLTQLGLGNDSFPRELERCCSIHIVAFTKGNKQPNDGNGKHDYDATNNEERKDCFISAHITMDSAAVILVAHASNDSMWETTDNNNIGLLVDKEIEYRVLILHTIIKNPEVRKLNTGKPEVEA